MFVVVYVRSRPEKTRLTIDGEDESASVVVYRCYYYYYYYYYCACENDEKVPMTQVQSPRCQRALYCYCIDERHHHYQQQQQTSSTIRAVACCWTTDDAEVRAARVRETLARRDGTHSWDAVCLHRSISVARNHECTEMQTKHVKVKNVVPDIGIFAPCDLV